MSEKNPSPPSEYNLKSVDKEAETIIEGTKLKITPEPVPIKEEEVTVSEVEVGESRVTGGIVPELELPPSADELRIVKKIFSRPIGLQVGFETTTINATETGWYRFEFSESFDSPPQVFVTIEHRSGEPFTVEYPKPTLTIPKISRPGISVPSRTFGTPLVDVKSYAENLKEQAKNVAIALLGWTWGWPWDWLRGWFLAVYLSIVYFIMYALGTFWNKMISPIASGIRQVMSDVKAVGNGLNYTVEQVKNGVNKLADEVQNGINDTVGVLKGYIDDSVTRSIMNLYKFSDLPIMKLNTGVVRPPTTTYVDVLGYKDSKIHVLAIGRRMKTLEDMIKEVVEKKVEEIEKKLRRVKW